MSVSHFPLPHFHVSHFVAEFSCLAFSVAPNRTVFYRPTILTIRKQHENELKKCLQQYILQQDGDHYSMIVTSVSSAFIRLIFHRRFHYTQLEHILFDIQTPHLIIITHFGTSSVFTIGIHVVNTKCVKNVYCVSAKLHSDIWHDNFAN